MLGSKAHALVAIALLSTLGGCDLLKDAASFTVCTDYEKFSIDSAQVGLSAAAGQIVPEIACTTTQDICAQATAQISCSGGSYACEIKCGASAKCEVTATVEAPPKTIDLSQKIKNSLQASAIDSVSLESVKYRITANSLNFNTPSINVYVGPNTATKSSDGTLFATIPSIAKGQTEPDGKLTPTAAGQTALNGFVKNYQTPFNLLSSATMSFSTGDPLPQGKLEGEIASCFKISPL